TTSTAYALDHVTWRNDQGEHQAAGRVVVEARDGGLLLEGRDGTLWSIQPDQLIAHTADDVPFTALQGDLLERQLLSELGSGFEVHRTSHYTLFYNTSPEYARWCAGLYERLYTGFYNFWK